MQNLFQRCFNDETKIVNISKKCCEINMSNYIGSDISIIIHILKMIGTVPRKTSDIREIIFNQYSDIVKSILFSVWITEYRFIEVIHDHKSVKLNLILSKLSMVNSKCYSNTHNAIVISLILGILSGIPRHKRPHRYDDYFFNKMKLITLSVTRKPEDFKKRYIVLKNMIRELSTLTYDDSVCDGDLIDTVVLFVTVQILINILLKKKNLNRTLSKLIYNDNTSLLNELVSLF